MVALFLAFTGALHAQDMDTEQFVDTILLDLSIDGEPSVFVRAEIENASEDNLYIDSAPILDALFHRLKPEALRTIRDLTRGDGFIRFGDLEQAGLSTVFNMADLKLTIGIPAEIKEKVIISLQSQESAAMRGPVTDQADVSAVVNLRSEVRVTDSVTDEERSATPEIRSYLDGSINILSWVLESSGTFTWAGGFLAEHNYTRIVHDFTDADFRLTIGSLGYRLQGFQSAPDLIGIGVSHESFVETGKTYAPFSPATFFLNQPSRVEIALNGKQVRTFMLPSGSYDLRDFEWDSGINSAEIRIIGQDGSVSKQSWIFPFDSELLAPGEYDYSFAAGLPKESILSPGVEDVNAVMFYNRGFLDTLTAGANLQAALDRQLLGGRLLFPTVAGTLGLDSAVAHSNDAGWSGAALLGYSFSPRTIAIPFSLGLSAMVSSPGFKQGREKGDEVPLDFSGSFMQSLPAGFSFGTGFRLSLDRDFAPDEWSALFTMNKLVRNMSNFSLNLRLTSDGTSAPVWHGSVQFSAHPTSSRLSGSVSHQLDGGATYIEINRRQKKPADDYSLSLSFTPQVNPPRLFNNISASASYFNYLFETGISGTYFPAREGEPWSAQGEARLDTAIVFADGTFSLSHPVNDSFVIAVPGKPGKPVGLNPSSGGGYGGYGVLLPAVLPTTGTYDVTQVIVELPGLDILDGEVPTSFIVRQGYRSGTVLRLSSAAPVYAVGTLFMADGNPVKYGAGTATKSESDSNTVPVEFFTDEEGVFEIQGLSSGTWNLILYDHPDFSAQIVIPDGFEGAFEAGTAALTPDNGGES